MSRRSNFRAAIAAAVASLVVAANALPQPQVQETAGPSLSQPQSPGTTVTTSLPLPQVSEVTSTVGPTSPPVWVHVSATQHAFYSNSTTITPTTTVDANGLPTTLSAPPWHLTATRVFTSLEGGTKPVTYTGVNPTPTGISEFNITGDYLACGNSVQLSFGDKANDKPLFCTPQQDTVLRPGNGYYSEQIPRPFHTTHCD